MTRKTTPTKPRRRISRGQIAILLVVLVVLWWRSGSSSREPASQVLPPVQATVQIPTGAGGDSLAESLDQTFTQGDTGFEAGSLDAVQAATVPPAASAPTPTSDASGWSVGSVAAAEEEEEESAGTRGAASQAVSGLPTIYYDDLPREAKETIRLIDQGGPFPFYQDDATFQNRERILPAQNREYYREYTVVTPGSDDRGARRIISGADGELFYTDDHYDSFREILR